MTADCASICTVHTYVVRFVRSHWEHSHTQFHLHVLTLWTVCVTAPLSMRGILYYFEERKPSGIFTHGSPHQNLPSRMASDNVFDFRWWAFGEYTFYLFILMVGELLLKCQMNNHWRWTAVEYTLRNEDILIIFSHICPLLTSTFLT